MIEDMGRPTFRQGRKKGKRFLSQDRQNKTPNPVLQAVVSVRHVTLTAVTAENSRFLKLTKNSSSRTVMLIKSLPVSFG
jgi:hypothetical protein